MILYHGTNIDIQKIELTKCKPYKDFGQGFYLTTIKEQAERMAKRTAKMYGNSPVINEYQFSEAVLNDKSLNIRIFEKPTEEWARFVITNRNYNRLQEPNSDNNFDSRYDIVIGPIANDDLALLFRQFSEGLISAESLVAEMKYKKLTNQYSFHTESALQKLIKTGAYNV